MDLAQRGPIGLFDYHLKHLSDSYLLFFQERAKIEEAYVESLFRLHRKVKSIDGYIDDRVQSSTVRRGWTEVRDNLEREAQARKAFLETLQVDVINPLSALRETQDRTRKRIKDDIKESNDAYTDYLETTVPRLRRNYLKKCQEVEDHKASQAAALNAIATSPSNETNPLTTSRSNPNSPSPVPPTVTAPQPLRPLARRPSSQQPQPRNRSPSTSTALQDLAHQGKRQLNQLKTFLDGRGGTVKEGLGGRGDAALKSVRAKREAEEADKEYRKAIHWLETLRIRRMKILEGGFKSLESFIIDSAEKMKDVLTKYVDCLVATAATQGQLATHAQDNVNYISPIQEISFLASSVPQFLHQTTPRRTLYHNYHVGECNDLIFGVSLVDYATSRGLGEGDVPKIVRMCINEVEKRGLNSEGIYRVSGRHAIVQDLMHKIEKDENRFQFSPTDDIFVIASLLKQYLRELPEPLFKFPLEERVKHTEELGDHIQNNFLYLRGRMRRLPPVHQATLKVILDHLARVASNCEKNKMDPKNLAIIFGAITFGEDELPKNGDLLSMANWKDTLMEDLITHTSALSDDRNVGNSYPPLPPAPQDEDTPSYGYGSSFTHVSTLPDEGGYIEDFRPQLPPRPSHSIHPSRRSNAQALNSSETTPGGDELPVPRTPIRSPREIAFTESITSETPTVVDTETLSPAGQSSDYRDSIATVDSFVSAQSSPPETANGSLDGSRTPRRSQELPISPESPSI